VKYQKAYDACQPVATSLVDRLLTGISPWRCVLCSDPAAGMDICPACLEDLPWLGHACCGCAIPLPDSGLRLCGSCLSSQSAPDPYVIALAYEYPVAQMLAALKFRKTLPYARVLGELLSMHLRKALLTKEIRAPDLLVPVPLHPLRQLQRTFNQAELIAEHVARNIYLPVKRQIVRRIRNTPAQMKLGRTARLENLRGSFAVSGDLSGAKIALLDDVVTTCATVKEISRMLKFAGANEVQVWAVARTV